MNDLFQDLKAEFQDEEYRYGYAQSFLNTKLAAHIKTLREQRGMTQAEVATAMNIKQPGYRRFEDVNHSVWKTDSLWNIARALGVRVNISFETFGTLPDEKKRLNKESLQLPKFEDDPAFAEAPTDVAAKSGVDLSWLGNTRAAADQAIAVQHAQQKQYGNALDSALSVPPTYGTEALSRSTRKRSSRRHRGEPKPTGRPSKVILFPKLLKKRKRKGFFPDTEGALAMSSRRGFENLKGQYGTSKAS